jgi:hypothetical protein
MDKLGRVQRIQIILRGKYFSNLERAGKCIMTSKTIFSFRIKKKKTHKHPHPGILSEDTTKYLLQTKWLKWN